VLALEALEALGRFPTLPVAAGIVLLALAVELDVVSLVLLG
jgi:hypothetical protein